MRLTHLSITYLLVLEVLTTAANNIYENNVAQDSHEVEFYATYQELEELQSELESLEPLSVNWMQRYQKK